MSKRKAKKQPKDLLDALTLEEEKSEDPILNEIEILFDRIKESDLMTSEYEEQRETIASNLIVAYYLSKLERKLK